MRGPTELLDRVFSFLEQPSKRLSPQNALVPASLVCRRWRPIAQRRLFQSIAFTSSVSKIGGGLDSQEIFPSRTQRLDPILANDRGLAALIYELRTATDDYDCEETMRVVGIIRHCPNLRRVEIFGYSNEALPALKAVLLEKSLVELTISSYG